MDSYETPPEPVLPLLPHIAGVSTFAEPCAGRGKLVAALESHGFRCVYQGDILYGEDALARSDYGDCDAIITNTPWTRTLMHPLLDHFMRIAPTWLLLDADWCHNQQAAPYLPHCSHIVSVGRIKWMPDSPSTGKDNAAWLRFWIGHKRGPRFFGRQPVVRHQSIGRKNEVEAA